MLEAVHADLESVLYEIARSSSSATWQRWRTKFQLERKSRPAAIPRSNTTFAAPIDVSASWDHERPATGKTTV